MMLLRRQRTERFPVQLCLQSLGQYTGFVDNIGQDFSVLCCLELGNIHKIVWNILPMQCVRTTTKRIFFLCNVVWGFLANISQDFYQWNVVPKVLRQQWTGFFSCAILSGASWTTLHKAFSCVMLSQEH